jgi:hypothetical protein
VIGVINKVYDQAYIVRDAVLLDVSANLPLAQRVRVPLYEAGRSNTAGLARRRSLRVKQAIGTHLLPLRTIAALRTATAPTAARHAAPMAFIAWRDCSTSATAGRPCRRRLPHRTPIP